MDLLYWVLFAACVVAMIAFASWAIIKISGPVPSMEELEDTGEYKGAWYE